MLVQWHADSGIHAAPVCSPLPIIYTTCASSKVLLATTPQISSRFDLPEAQLIIKSHHPQLNNSDRSDLMTASAYTMSFSAAGLMCSPCLAFTARCSSLSFCITAGWFSRLLSTRVSVVLLVSKPANNTISKFSQISLSVSLQCRTAHISAKPAASGVRRLTQVVFLFLIETVTASMILQGSNKLWGEQLRHLEGSHSLHGCGSRMRATSGAKCSRHS